MDINKFIDNQMAAWARNDMIGMLADVGQAMWGTGLKFSGAKYRSVLVGQLMVNAAAALEECWKREGLIQTAEKPEHPGDVVVKVTVPDRASAADGHLRGEQEAAATATGRSTTSTSASGWSRSAADAASQAAGERITIRREDGGVTLPGNFSREAAVQKLACYEDICPDPDELHGRMWAPPSRYQAEAMRAAVEDVRGRLLEVSTVLAEAADLLGGVPPEEYRDEK